MALPTQIGTPTTGGSTGTSHSRSYTCTSGSNRTLFAFISQINSTGTMSVTYNGTSLTEEFVLDNVIKTWVFRLDEANYPAAGSYTLSSTGDDGTSTSVTIVEFENVNQNNLFEFSWNFNDGSGGAFSTINTPRTDAPIDGVFLSYAVNDSDSFTHTPNSGQTELLDSSPTTGMSLALGYENFVSGGADELSSWQRDSSTTDSMISITVVFGPPSNVTVIDDQFTGTALNSHWYKYDPQNHALINVSSGNINLTVISGSLHDLWETNKDGVAILQDVSDKELTIEIGLESTPTNNQARGIVFFNPTKSEWIRFDQYASPINLFFAYVPFGGSATTWFNGSSPGGVTNLRLTRIDAGGGDWTYVAEYSTNNGDSWVNVGGSQTSSMVLSSVGITSMNFGSFPEHTASYSYFYDTNDGITLPTETQNVIRIIPSLRTSIFGSNF